MARDSGKGGGEEALLPRFGYAAPRRSDWVTALAYPKFKTNGVDGKPIVADAGASRPRVVAVAMANFIPDTGWSGFTRVIGQIGIGATADSPVLLAGTGIRLTSPSATVLTFGVSFPFVQRLKSLEIGNEVSGEVQVIVVGPPAAFRGSAERYFIFPGNGAAPGPVSGREGVGAPIGR